MLSDRFIKQARKCNPLQEAWNIDFYDRIYHTEERKIYWVLDTEKIDKSIHKWMPTQEQIQDQLRKESIKLKQVNDLQLLSLMRIGTAKCACNTYLKQCSLNELWLFYYMFELHKQIWNESNKCWEKK